MCLWSLLGREGLKGISWRWEISSISPETGHASACIGHCISCPRCQMKEHLSFGVSCNVAVRDRQYKWPTQESYIHSTKWPVKAVVCACNHVYHLKAQHEVSHPYSCGWDLRGSVYDAWKEKGAAMTRYCNVWRLSQGSWNYRFHKSWLSSFAIPPDFPSKPAVLHLFNSPALPSTPPPSNLVGEKLPQVWEGWRCQSCVA